MLLKYDDVISMLTVVNVLAKDVNYGVNPESVIYDFCDEKQNTNIQKICFINRICNLKFAKFNFYKFFHYIKICVIEKNKILMYFCALHYNQKFSLYKNLVMFLEKMIFYDKYKKQEYG